MQRTEQGGMVLVPLVSLVVPVYNEGEAIAVFYNRVRHVLEEMGEPYEIIFVNDGSRDDSLERLLALAGADACVRVIDLSRNFGKEAALSAGIDYAQGDVVIPIDADLQDPPELIPELLAGWRAGFDVVYARRTARDGESFLKRFTARCFYRLLAAITDVEIPVDTGDYRLLSRPVVEALKRLPERHRFMKGLFSWIGFRQAPVYYRRESRVTGHSKYSYLKMWNLALEGITSFSHTPLRLATCLGFAVALFAFCYAVFIVVRTLVSGCAVPGYPSLITVVLFLGGVQLLTIGILGEYIGRIYDETKQRPIYIVRGKYGFPAGTGADGDNT